MKTPISELTNEQLDNLCAELQGWKEGFSDALQCAVWLADGVWTGKYEPTTNHEQSSLLAEKYFVSSKFEARERPERRWQSFCCIDGVTGNGYGKTARRAKVEAFVDAMTGGDGVEL